MTFRALGAMQEMRRYLAKRLNKADLGRWDAEVAALQEAMTWHMDVPRSRTPVIGFHEHWGPIVVYWDGEVWVMTINDHPIPRDAIRAWTPCPDHIASLVNAVKQR